MIITALLSLLAWLIALVASGLPEGTFLPVNFSDFVTDLVAYAWTWDWLISMQTVFSVLTAIIIFVLAEITWRMGKYLIAVFRGM